MKLRKLLLAGSAAVMLTVAPAQASVIDNPHFKVLGLVIVWGTDAAGTAPIASDFVINSAAGAGDADLIAGDVHTVVTGSLLPTPDTLAGASPFNVSNAVAGGVFTDAGSVGVLDAADSFTAFTLNGTTDVSAAGATYDSSFYVASNTPFAIDAVASTVAANTVNFSLANVGYALEVTPTATDGALTFGANAQFPHTGGATGGVVSTVNDLGDMATSTNVFTGNRRTAATVGSIVGQSVRFDATYSLGGAAGYDLSMGVGEIEANVTYTVFVP
jgi:hypothetical protein